MVNTTKAQIILVGGRPIPNILTLIHQQPELVVAVCSKQSAKEEWPKLQQGIKNLLPSVKIEAITVDGFVLPEIRRACEEILARRLDDEDNTDGPNIDWLVNVTAATTVMSIGAYEAAKEYASKILVRCWYLDTAGSRIATLVGESTEENIFHLEVAQYAAAYNCRLVPGSLEDQRQYSEEHWIPFAQAVAKNPDYIDLLKKMMRSIKKPRKEDGLVRCSILDTGDGIYTLLEEALNATLVKDLERKNGEILFRWSYAQANFLNGPWLEAYVWDEMRKIGIFSDCRWNQRIIDIQKPTDNDNKNELDVSMIYKAQLFIIECKTEEDSFKPDFLYKLDSIAGTLGARFVSRFFVSSSPAPDGRDRNKQATFESFQEKAKDREITLITREDLPNVGTIVRDKIVRVSQR